MDLGFQGPIIRFSKYFLNRVHFLRESSESVSHKQGLIVGLEVAILGFSSFPRRFFFFFPSHATKFHFSESGPEPKLNIIKKFAQ